MNLYHPGQTARRGPGKFLIEKGRTTGLKDKLGVLLLGGSITDEQYMELAAMLPVEE